MEVPLGGDNWGGTGVHEEVGYQALSVPAFYSFRDPLHDLGSL